MTLRTSNHWFLDKENRSVILRGVNLGGSTKVPVKPNGATHIKTEFADHRDASFIGRPFPSDEAQEHLERLKDWGFNCLRFLTTWEAIEHKGPDKYDSAYLDYLRDMIQLASDLEFYIFIDPHQDVWSRMTGGDGAPGWLFEKVGLDFTKFNVTDAAIVMQHRYPHDYPITCWPGNRSRFASAIMFTLFFGGNDFAPECKTDGVPIQEFMQSHYINSIKQIAKRCKDIESVIGYDTLNEPSRGFIGYNDIQKKEGLDPPGLWFSPFEAMVTAAGIPYTIPVYGIKRFKMRKIGEKLVNPERISCWLPDHPDIWREHKVWDLDSNNKPIALKPDYFNKSLDGKEITFFHDYLRPFINHYAEEIRSIVPETLIFMECESLERGDFQWGSLDAKNIVNANHWYDGLTLVTKKFLSKISYDIVDGGLVIGPYGIQKMFKRQLGYIKEMSSKIHGGVPTLIGEFGIPFDLDSKRAYTTGDFSQHVKALSWNYNALDHHLLHSTLWNYTAGNCNEWGDLWNQEDFSIFSRDQQSDLSDINSGGRAVEGFCRPYAKHTAGNPLKMVFDRRKGKFSFCYEADLNIEAPTVIYTPTIQYPKGYNYLVSGGSFHTKSVEQHLMIWSEEARTYNVTIKRTD